MTTKRTTNAVKPVVPAKPKTITVRFGVGVDGSQYSVTGGTSSWDTDAEIEERLQDEVGRNAVIRFVELEIPLPEKTPTLKAVLVG